MGMGPVVAAETYNRVILNSDKPLNMMQMPVVGWCMTYSASSTITDSAAAGTALSTGTKTKNGMLGMNPDTADVVSVAKKLQAMGYGIGVTTSVAPDDATPGAFYAHVPFRGMFYEIGTQMAGTDYEFIAGAGLRGLVKDGKGTDLLKHFADNKVQIVRGPKEIANINSKKVLLLNPEGTADYDIGYTIDSINGVLNLPLIAETCLKHLEKTSPDKFFMMVEGGNIDHALHANDGGAAVKEILNFDQALGVAFDFYQKHPDETLIIVTADHDTGGMSIVKDGGLGNIDYQRVSKEVFSEYCKAMRNSRMIYTWDDMQPVPHRPLRLLYPRQGQRGRRGNTQGDVYQPLRETQRGRRPAHPLCRLQRLRRQGIQYLQRCRRPGLYHRRPLGQPRACLRRGRGRRPLQRFQQQHRHPHRHLRHSQV